jgi:ABC-2 type transport system permease protein
MSTAPTTRRPPADAVAEEALHAALASGARPPRASALSAAMAFGWRGMLKVKHVPEQLIDATITPVLFLLMFTYLFGGAVAGSTAEYLEYIFPGILAQSVLFTCVYSGVSLNTDVTKGVVDRFRSLPIWRPSPLVGAVLGDSTRYVLASLVVVVLGLIMGYGPDGGAGGMIAAIVLVVVFAFGMSWIFITVGMIMRSPSAVLNAGFMTLFPFIFLSNVFVDPSTLPGWLEAFVDVNPISHLVTATRGLMEGHSDGGDIALVLGEAAALTAVFAPLTVRLYLRKG